MRDKSNVEEAKAMGRGKDMMQGGENDV